MRHATPLSSPTWLIATVAGLMASACWSSFWSRSMASIFSQSFTSFGTTRLLFQAINHHLKNKSQVCCTSLEILLSLRLLMRHYTMDPNQSSRIRFMDGFDSDIWLSLWAATKASVPRTQSGDHEPLSLISEACGKCRHCFGNHFSPPSPQERLLQV